MSGGCTMRSIVCRGGAGLGVLLRRGPMQHGYSHMGSPCGLTDMTEKITFWATSLAGGNKLYIRIKRSNLHIKNMNTVDFKAVSVN